MNMPDKDIVYALIESYLNMRKGKWSLVNANDEIILPDDDSETAQKIDVCVKILQHAKDCLYTQEWEELLKLVYNLEQNELEKHNNYWLPRRKFGSVLLIETLQAIRSYLLQQLNTDNPVYKTDVTPILNKYKEALTTHTNYVAHPDKYSYEQIEKAKNALDEADKQYKPYNLDELQRIHRDHLSYFANRIMVNDPRSKELKELSFSDFEKNVKHPDEKLKRKSDVCMKLLSPKHAHTQSAFTPASTASVSNKSIVADSTKTADKSKEVKFATPEAPAVVTTTAKAPTVSSSSSTSKSKSSHHKSQDTKSSALRDNSTFKSDKSSSSSRKTNSNDNDADLWLNELLEASKTNHTYNTRSRNR